MTDTAQTIENIIKVRLNNFLVGQGFSRHGMRFLKNFTHAIQVIKIEGRHSGFGNSEKFTINFGLYFPAIAGLENKPIAALPQILDCQLQESIGNLMPGNREHWWMIIKPIIDADVMAVEVKESVSKFGLPWLESSMESENAAQGVAASAYLANDLAPTLY